LLCVFSSFFDFSPERSIQAEGATEEIYCCGTVYYS